MDKELLEKMYQIYLETNSPSLFSKIRFQRRMNSKRVDQVISNMKDTLLDIFYLSDISREDLSTIYLRLCEQQGTQNVHKTFKTIFSRKGDNESIDKNEKRQKSSDVFCQLLGLRDRIDIRPLGPNAVKLLKLPKNEAQKLFDTYKEEVYEMCMRDKKLSIEATDIELHTAEDFYQAINSGNTVLGVLTAINFAKLMEMHSIEELKNNHDTVSKEIRLGYDTIKKSSIWTSKVDEELLEKHKNEILELSDDIDFHTIQIIRNASDYYSAMRLLTVSGRFIGEEYDLLKEMTASFSHLRVFDAETAEQVLQYMKETVKGSKKAPEGSIEALPLGERLKEYVNFYEALYREDIVQNVTEIKKENKTTIQLQTEKGDAIQLNGVLIDSVEKFGNPLVHLFGNERMMSDAELASYMAYHIVDHELRRNQKSKEEMKKFIKDVFKQASRASDWSMQSIDDRKVMNTKILNSMMQFVPQEAVYSEALDYKNAIMNNAIIHKISRREKEVLDKIQEFLGEEATQYNLRASDDTHISTQILRLRNSNDAKRLPRYETAILFDKNGMSGEDILLSSMINLESNNTGTAYFSDLTPKERSASFDILRNEEGIAHMTSRRNNELVLSRESVRPSALLYFGGNKVNNQDIENIDKAMKSAYEAGLTFVYVNCEEIEKQLNEKEHHYSKTAWEKEG